MNFGQTSKNFKKSSENVRKSSGIAKISLILLDTNFIFSYSIRHFTRGYRVEHSEVTFVLTRGHVISSICMVDQVSV